MNKLNIVITDGESLNPGDLSWDEMAQFGDLQYYDSTPKELVAERCREADIIVCNKTLIDEAVLATARKLKLIAVTATGYNNIDTRAAAETGVVVCNVPEYGTYSVAQHAFSLLLELVNHVGTHDRSVKNGDWTKSGRWCYSLAPIRELRDKILGIVGYGRIGRQMGVLARAFGMETIFFNRSAVTDPHARQTDLETLFRGSDVVSLHCPLTPDNTGFVNERMLSLMKPSAILINTARGQLINEQDLAAALKNNIISAAGLDVLSSEPPASGHSLISLPNCIVTPHNAWLSVEARTRMMQLTLENIRKFLAGQPQHVVNPS